MTFILIGITFLVTSFWYFTSGPNSFPTDEQLVEEITNSFSILSNSEIQDIVFLDDRHVFVPFKAEDEMYGFSLWKWNNRKWNEVFVSTNGDVRVWKIDSKDPTTFRVVWNYPPQDKVSYMKLYLVHERGAQVSDYEEHYKPAVQLEQTIRLSENLYGSIKLSQEWIPVLQSFNDSPIIPSYYFGWNTYDSSDKSTYPERNEIGNSSGGGDTYIDFPIYFEESVLE